MGRYDGRHESCRAALAGSRGLPNWDEGIFEEGATAAQVVQPLREALGGALG